MQSDDKEQKTIFGFPVVEVDKLIEMEDKVILFGDWSNLFVCVNIKPPNSNSTVTPAAEEPPQPGAGE